MAPKSARRNNRRWQTIIATAAATLLAAPFALPAFADTAEPDAIDVIRVLEQAQTVTINADATGMAVTRDGYTVTTPPPPPPPVPVPQAVKGGYASTADTFTNNPASPVQWPFTQGVPISDRFGYRSAPCAGCSSKHQAST